MYNKKGFICLDPEYLYVLMTQRHMKYPHHKRLLTGQWGLCVTQLRSVGPTAVVILCYLAVANQTVVSHESFECSMNEWAGLIYYNMHGTTKGKSLFYFKDGDVSITTTGNWLKLFNLMCFWLPEWSYKYLSRASTHTHTIAEMNEGFSGAVIVFFKNITITVYNQLLIFKQHWRKLTSGTLKMENNIWILE